MANLPRFQLTRAGLALLLCLGWSAGAAEEDRFIGISDAVPEGFEALTQTQTTEADVFYGGLMVTTALVQFDLSTVTILDPVELLASIPNVRDPEKLALRLTGPQSHNAEHLCTRRNQSQCGRLEPEDVGVLFDADRFRLDLFVAPDELLTAQIAQDRYLPPSETGWSALHNVRSNVAGLGSKHTYRVSSESTLAYRHSRLSSRFSITNDGASLSTLSLRHDARDTEFEVGSFRTVGRNLSFTTDVDVIGARVSTSRKSRTDLASALGTPLYVFLHERSRVDVFRGDELIDSRYYDAGNQQINTTDFPDGAYDVRLRVTGVGGDVDEETHFFVRSGELPPQGEPTYYAEVGQLLDTQNHAVPALLNEPWVRLGSAHRLRQSLAVSNEVVHAGRKTLAQTGVFSIHKRGYVYGGAMASSSGDKGASFRAGWNSERVSAHLDVRAVEAVADRLGFDPVPDSYKQATATVAVPVKKGRVVMRGRMTERQGKRETAVGVSYWTSIMRRNGWSVDLTLDAQYADGRSSVRAGVQMRWRQGRSSAVARPQMTYQSGAEGSVQSQLDARWSRGYQHHRIGDLRQSVFASHSSQQSVFGTRIEAKHFPLSDLEFGYQQTDGRSNGYYTANNRFAIATTGGRTTISRGQGQAGAVVIHIDGNTDEKFEVVVDDRVVGYAWPNRGNVINLRPYKTYRIRVKPAGASIVGFDETTHRLTLYPGNVHELTFSAKSLVVLIGRLVDGTGAPLPHARFANVQGWAATDADGWFQVEATGFEPLSVTMRDGTNCIAAIEQTEVDQDLAMLDTVQCIRAPPTPETP